MTRFQSLAIVLALAASTPLWSQEGVHEKRGVVAGHAEAGAGATWVREGGFSTADVFVHGPGIRFEGPPKKGAPYSAEAVTETTQSLADGNRIRRENRSRIYRDSEGRTRREETLQAVGPWAVANDQPTRTTVFINDPVAGVHWVLEPEKKIARKMQIPSFADHMGAPEGATFSVAMAPPEGATGPVGFTQGIEERSLTITQSAVTYAAPAQSAEQPNMEDLGMRMIEGVEAKGTKITRTIPAGEIGNERPIEVVFERWYSEELGVDVMTKRTDPRSAEMTYTLTNIQRTEPLPGMFQPPPDYEVKEPEGNVLFQKVERK